MTVQRHAVFVINLLQDVNVVRPLVYMAARDLGLRTAFLVSRYFVDNDKSFAWQEELDEIGKATGTPMLVFDNEMEAALMLQDKAGILVAGSESDIGNHVVSHNVMRAAPPSFVRITLQHGFECVGFLHNGAHDAAHGREVTFAADVICGWSEPARLRSVAPSQRSKLYVSGPPVVLQMARNGSPPARGDTGLVCENLHSARLSVGGNFKAGFIESFNGFCNSLAKDGRSVVLRPHPGGQYVLKNPVQLPENAIINNHPMYKVDLRRYAYGISAPSSVLLDMVLAGIPVAVWRDAAGAMDTRNYEGLTEISGVKDWIDFSREAVAHPQRFLERQSRFLERQEMPTDPAEVHRRFAELFNAALRDSGAAVSEAKEAERILFIATSRDASLELCLLKPLAPLVENGEIATEVITEVQMKRQFGAQLRQPVVQKWLDKQFTLFAPTLVVFSRYGGPHAAYMAERARQDRIPVIYHLDDDLLNVPMHVGLKKYQRHNDPLRLAAVRHLLGNADLVYCSTPRLRDRLKSLGATAPLFAGELSFAGEVLVPAEERPVRKIGYMGIDKSNDLELVLPAIVEFLRRHPEIDFELFGSFTKPVELEEFGERIKLHPTIKNYDEFLDQLALLNWDIGICPLAPTLFNLCKANNKWIEYTSAGAAVIASRGTVYDESCADGCGSLVSSAEEWLAALEYLTRNPAERFVQVTRAQAKLASKYTLDRLREQTLGVLATANEVTTAGPISQ
jgi:glycosyltransferase involved in cell wall biosynthesis